MKRENNEEVVGNVSTDEVKGEGIVETGTRAEVINDDITKREKRIARTRNLVLVALFASLTAVGAFIRIPIPVVPFTLQLLFTMLAGLLLGGKLGCLSVCVYIFVGLIGVPIFTQGGGPSYVLQPTFGYIIGFAVGALVTGLIANKVENPSYGRILVANFVGLFIVYLFGMVYYYLISTFYMDSPIGIWTLFLNCFLLAVPGDIFLCIAGGLLAKKLIPILRRIRM